MTLEPNGVGKVCRNPAKWWLKHPPFQVIQASRDLTWSPNVGKRSRWNNQLFKGSRELTIPKEGHKLAELPGWDSSFDVDRKRYENVEMWNVVSWRSFTLRNMAFTRILLNQPVWKICSSNWIISRDKQKKCLKPPPRGSFFFKLTLNLLARVIFHYTQGWWWEGMGSLFSRMTIESVLGWAPQIQPIASMYGLYIYLNFTIKIHQM